MFTGIVEEVGVVKSLDKSTLIVECSKVLEDVKIGDSIMVNGVCQTVVQFGQNYFTVNVSPETFRVTTFSDFKKGDNVNLERALTLSSRLGGHIVSGHVDCKGKCIHIEKLSDFYNITFEIPEDFSKYVVQKGSITIDGISLTVAGISGNTFFVALIPHTFENTSFRKLEAGCFVNIETDILARYVEKMISVNDNKSKISMSFLAENGFV